MKKLLLIAGIFLAASSTAPAVGDVIQGELTPGVYRNAVVDSNSYLYVNCPGCTGAAAPTGANNADSVASVATGLSPVEAFLFGYNGATWDRLQLDASKFLKVNCATGCAGGTFNNNADAVATSATNGQTAAWLYGYNGATWDRLQVDASKYLKVNCITGCAGGTFNNNGDGVATSATNGQSAAWLYGFNGSTWDRLQVDGSKFLKVSFQNTTIAVTNAGTFATQAAQSGTWNITNVSGTVSLPTGASTAAKQPALGTAGTASTDVLTIQGIASMTKLLVTPDSVALPANQSVNVAQLAGTTTDTNSGNKSAGTLRVVLATDQPALTNKLLVTPDSVALPANQSVNLSQIGGTAVVADPCQIVAKTSLAISQATSTQIISGTSSKKTYICSITLVAGAAENVAITAGTGSVCATGSSAIIGSTTVANGLILAANSGFSHGNGRGTVASGTVNADNICLLQSGSVRVSGVLTYVQN